MDGVLVAEVFPPPMARNFQMLQEDRPARIKPLTARTSTSARPPADTCTKPTAWWCSRARRCWDSRQSGPDRRRPLREYLGRQHPDPGGRRPPPVRVSDGDLVAFLWIGAGNGAMNGYAALILRPPSPTP